MSFQLSAQQRRITGTVIDGNDNTALIGANISEKGTSNGTITDFNGRFALNLTTDNSILVVSMIGFKTIEVIVGNQSTINIALEEDTEMLEEVVVVGYGTMKKVTYPAHLYPLEKKRLKVQSLQILIKHYKDMPQVSHP